MAHMIPAQISSATPSSGEREIFRRLADDPGTSHWIVLHSLDIAVHVKRISGEADFVIIVPHKGILCLEVKATTKIKREQGLWYYGNDPNPDVRGPFKQSAEAMHSIRKRLLEKDSSLTNVLFWSAVLFPYLRFSISSVEWHHWQVIDSIGFRREPISSLMLKVLSEAKNHLKQNNTRLYDASRDAPTGAQCGRIVDILRADFELYEPPRERLERLENQVRKFTAEQFVALDAMAANPRVVFRGPAGTGKTLLAIEAARRSRARGNRVLFLCYNRLLGRHLEMETSALRPDVTTTTLHKHMLSVSGIQLHGETRSRDFWLEELPKQAIEKLVEDPAVTNLYDEIIIDEAQDLLRGDYLDFLDLSVRGGLSAGNWKMFGDFEKQAIYDSNADMSIDEAISTRLGAPPSYSLRTNCRNTPRIVSLVHLFGNLYPEYSRILRPDDGVEPRISYYRDDKDQLKLLLHTIQKLKQEGFANTDITVLSTKSHEKAVTSLVNNADATVKFNPFEHASKKRIGCGSIHAFKGMESPAIIVTDVDTIVGDQAASLFYVAMTRALHRLYILANHTIKHAVLEIILKS